MSGLVAETAACASLLHSAIPCVAVDRHGFVRIESPGVRRLGVSAVDRPLAEVFAIDPEAVASCLAGDGSQLLTSDFADGQGRRAYLVAQAVRLPHDETLLIFTDCTAARRAEERRFDATPYPVLRLSGSGRILFANQLASHALNVAAPDLIGQSLADLFPDAAGGELRQALGTMTRESQSFDLPAPPAIRETCTVSEIRLFLMPDMGLDDRVLGRVAVISWDPWESWRDRISAAANTDAGWESALRAMIDVLREVVPHDRASFGVLAENGSRFRAALVHPRPQSAWPRRWINVPPARRERLANGPYIVGDWPATVNADPALALDPIVQLNLADDIKSILVLPVGNGDRVDAVLTLESRSYNAFDGAPLAIMSALRLDAQLSALLRLADRESTVAIKHILDELLGAPSIAMAAELLLSRLVEHFQWDHAALHLADPVGKRILLYRQYPVRNPDGTRSDLAIEPGYERPLDPARPEEAGMLGQTFWQEQPLLVEDTGARTDGTRPYNFRPATPTGAQLSALTAPVRLDGEVRWLLAIVARTTHAFGEEDKRDVMGIVEQLERRVTLLRERLLSKQLLELSEQGVAVTDRGGRILRANRRARDLLRLSGEEGRWGVLYDYGADETARALFSSDTVTERRQIRVGPPGGVGSAVLASRRDVASEAGESVWLFTDLRAEEWEHDSRFVENTIRTVARQARGPLMLAASMVKRLAAEALGNDLATRAVAELAKADVTYQRIAESLIARKEPMRETLSVAMDTLIAGLLRSLPPRDAARIDYAMPQRPLAVLGDRSRLEMAFSLMLAAVLGRSLEAGFRITLRRRGLDLVIAVSPRSGGMQGGRLKPLPPKPGDPMETASIIIEAHRGHLQGAGLESGNPRLAVVLPLAEAFQPAAPTLQAAAAASAG